MNKKLGFIALLGTALLWGSTGIGIRILSQKLEVFQQIILRNAVAVLILLVIILAGHKLASLWKKKFSVIQLVLFSVILPLSIILNAITMLHMKIGVATFMYYAGELIFSYIFGVIFFRERITLLKFISFVLALFGLSCFLYPFSIQSINLYVCTGLLSGLFGATSNVCRKSLSDSMDRYVLVFLPFVSGIIISVIMAGFFHQMTPFMVSLPAYIWIVGIIFGAILVISNYLVLLGFKNFDLGLGGVVLTSELFFASLFGFLFFGEIPLVNEFVGGFFIFTAVALSHFEFNRTTNRKS